jgi:hypothetical protein
MICPCKLKKIQGIWIVPQKTLLAYKYINSDKISKKVSDQTVWIIDYYNKGYFSGKSYLSIDGKAISVSSMTGTVTPSGSILINFFTSDGNCQGNGTYYKYDNNYQFTMQMSQTIFTSKTPVEVFNLTHWSYMIKVNPDDYLYNHLPGLNISVKKYIKMFENL